MPLDSCCGITFPRKTTHSKCNVAGDHKHGAKRFNHIGCYKNMEHVFTDKIIKRYSKQVGTKPPPSAQLGGCFLIGMGTCREVDLADATF